MVTPTIARSYSPSSLWTIYFIDAFYGAFLGAFQRVVRRRMKTTRLRGSPRSSFLYGVLNSIISSTDSVAMYENLAKEYGVVYQIPAFLGETRIVLCDPKALAHYYARETWTYVQIPFGLALVENMIGSGLLGAEGESHRRQRKALMPAFSNEAIRQLTSVFYGSVYKCAWDSIIESGKDGSAVIEVQNCLDTIGIAGFSHDFGSLDRKHSSVTDMFDTFSNNSRASTVNQFLFLLAQVFPVVTKFPTKRTKLIEKLNVIMAEISNDLLLRDHREKEANVSKTKQESIYTVKAEGRDAELHLSQMKTLLIAGYETTSGKLWALIELSQHLDVQSKLREELLAFGDDPTYDQLKANLPYLDAVVHETLRLHPPVPDVTRIAAADDVIPLSEPICTASGKMTESISVGKGTIISVSVMAINRSFAIWGPDAKQFKPDPKEVQGHRHLLTFVDGPRTCLGKDFAIAQFKLVLLVLVKNFVFEMQDGPETRIEVARTILPRSWIVGQDGTRVPLLVRWYE
ncbi:cytochrome P450 [Rhizopogon vinicolor AM-OR11-026]|uniref:Cytochrome P450 n=1 Tax=Rhizopogon vinicolor AM-OR11-026 TaxID=1314800 RepID=A0A1B7MTT6_9AGAM|nr:cytochrome P450 [Rhizopogon vinicolor AM-OR11-026]